MVVGRVVPDRGKLARRTVEGDSATDQQQPGDDVLDRAELV